jgi:hypothetical protein
MSTTKYFHEPTYVSINLVNLDETNSNITMSVTFNSTTSFEKSNITEITLFDGLTLGDIETFKDCTALNTLTFAGYSGSIPQGAFQGCTSLVEVIIPSTVASIGTNAFKGCTALNTLKINSYSNNGDISLIETIGQSAFEDCTSLAEVIIPSTVTVIGLAAFKNCKSGLNVIILNENLFLYPSPYSSNNIGAFDTPNTTLYTYRNFNSIIKDGIFGTNISTCRVIQHSFLSFNLTSAITNNVPTQGSQSEIYEVDYTINRKNAMGENEYITYDDLFNGITLSDISDKIVITIHNNGTDTTLNIPFLGSVNISDNRDIIDSLITKVGANIKIKLESRFDCVNFIYNDATFPDMLKRISVNIASQDNSNSNRETYLIVNNYYSTYSNLITINTNSDNFIDSFTTYFKSTDNIRLEFLNIFNLLKYDSIDINTYKKFKFNIYANTTFDYGNSHTMIKLIKIN